MLKGDEYIRKLMRDIYDLDTLNILTSDASFKVKYHHYIIEKNKSLESVINFYNKYGTLIYSIKLKYIYIKNNLINIY